MRVRHMQSVLRLVEMIQPISYRLHITPDLATFSFWVQESIVFDLVKSAQSLTFHALHLDITSVRLSTGQTGVPAYSPNEQTVRFDFEQPIEAGRHTLELEFSGTIHDNLHGFYRSQYEYNGQKRWLVTTQFEAVHAREAFVCIDEPAAKAIFEVALTVPAQLTAISNGHTVSERPVDDKRKTVVFAPTPRMSTYVLAYVVGEFEQVEGQTSEGVTVRVFATPGKKDQLGFALETGLRALSFFSSYFGLPYPLAKLDMIAMPDFAAGAMENWGAAIYRETDLLLDETKTSLTNKQRVAVVITHELSHQWFGDLVTMAWWNDLWLNEGFAAWAEVLAQDKLFPEWAVWEQFVGGRLGAALGDDALANTHPIEVEVEDPQAIDEIFDGISYDKGAGIINMLHHYLGAEEFRLGLSHYLKTYQYGNATTQDLWRALGEASGKPVEDIMTAWTSLPGYPLVELEAGTLRQKRFYSSPPEAARANSRQMWPLPFDAVTEHGEVGGILVTGPETKLPAGLAAARWCKPNPGQTGFYRTLYTPAMIQALMEPLSDGHLAAPDRYGVVSDVLETAQAGLSDSKALLGLIAALRDDADYVVWSKLSDGLSRLIAITEDKVLRQRLERFGRWFVQPGLKRLGWDKAAGQSSLEALLRPLVLEQAIRLDDPAATAEAKRRFEMLREDKTVDPDLRAAVFLAIARHGGAAEFDMLLEMYRQEQVPQVKKVLLVSLCRFRQPDQIRRSLELGLSDDVRSQDTVWTLAHGLKGRESRSLTWQFMQDNWDIFVRRYGGGGHMLSRLPVYAGGGFASHQAAEEVAAFFAAHSHPVIARPAAQAVEAINLKADWYMRDRGVIEEFLDTWELDNANNH